MAVFNKNRRSPRTQEDYISALDEILRRNTGSFTAQGYDTSSNTPYFLPDTRNVMQPQGLEGGIQLAQMQYPASEYMPMGMTAQYPQMTNSRQDRRMDAASFLREISRSSEPQVVESTQDGGIYLSNGLIKYRDGTERAGNPYAYAVSSMADGIGYSDGSVRRISPTLIRELGNGKGIYSDGSVRYVSEIEGSGINALTQGLFGREIPITQAYGNRNASLYPRTGMHRGLDIGARNEQLTSPFKGVVVQRFYDDNTRWGTQTGHKGYGNSVLVQLDTGEMLRFSHLSESDLAVGDVIEPGTIIGITGSTGNSTGAHLDLEYYDADGKINNPANFSMLQNGGMRQAGSIIDYNELSDSERKEVEKYKEYRPQERQSRPDTNLSNQEYQSKPQPIIEEQQPQYPQIKVAGDLSDAVDQFGTAYNLPDVGFSEYINQAGDLAGKAVYDTSINLENMASERNLPEAYIGEIMRGQQDVGASEMAAGNFREGGQKAANWIESVGNNTKSPNLGIGEGIRAASQFAQNIKDDPQKQLGGMVLGAKDIAQNMNPFNPKDAYASEDFNTNVPIGQKVNKNLIEGNILSALENIKSTFNIKDINPEGITNNILNTSQNIGSGIMNAGSQAVNAIGDVANQAKNVLVDAMDGESDENIPDTSASINNLVGYQSIAPTPVFQKSSSSSNKSSSSSKANKPKEASKPISSKPLVVVTQKATPTVSAKIPVSAQTTKTILQSGKLPMSSSTNPKAANYKPAVQSKPAPAKTTVFKKVTNIIKSIFKK